MGEPRPPWARGWTVVYRIPYGSERLERYEVVRWTKAKLLARDENGSFFEFVPKQFYEFDPDPIAALKHAIRFLKWKKIHAGRRYRLELELAHWMKYH